MYYSQTFIELHLSNQSLKKLIHLIHQPLLNTFEGIKKFLNRYQIRIGYKPNNCSTQCFSKIRPKYELKNQLSVVYSLKCQDCNCVYIGQISQYLKNRLSNHVNNIY